MKRMMGLAIALLMLAGCSQAAAQGSPSAAADETQSFAEVSDSREEAVPAKEPESDARPADGEETEEAEEASETWDSEPYAEPETPYVAYEEVGYAEPDYSAYNEDGPSRDMPGYYDGHVETYYSSNVLHHYRTDEWTPDEEGFYRDDNGYYVVGVGINDGYQLGDVIDTGKGKAIVSDFGTATNDVDFYTNW